MLRRLARRRPLLELLPYNENAAAFRINSYRREAIVDQTATLLGQLVDLDTGSPIFDAATRPSRDEPGSRAAQLPDLLVHYKAGAYPQQVGSDALGTIAAAPPILRPGNHLPGLYAVIAGTDAEAPKALEDFGPFAERVLAA